ncbi:MAG: hypothetical protein ABFD46_07695 [Armatimonadota bacterium]
MDREYLSTQLAEALGTAQGMRMIEHKLLNSEGLETGMKRQLQDIHDQDEQLINRLERVLDEISHGGDFDESIQRGLKIAQQLIDMSGNDIIELLRTVILIKYRLSDSQELFYNLCEEIGHDESCDIFEENLEDEEDHLDYLREQAILMARERITGQPVAG